MSLLETDFSNVKPAEVLPDGSEAKLRIIRMETDDAGKAIRTNKNGGLYIMPRFEIDGKPFAKEFNTYIPVAPAPGMDEKEANNAMRRLQEFYTCFGIKSAGKVAVDVEKDLPGKLGWAILGVEDDEYAGGQRNRVRKWILPK